VVAVDLPVVAAYILGYANANRDIADLAAYHEMRSCADAAASFDRAADEDLRGRTFRDEHIPGAIRHIKDREYRLDNRHGERGYTGGKGDALTRDQWVRQWEEAARV
jgi:hypothetical protein